jgi:hypothetical protein
MFGYIVKNFVNIIYTKYYGLRYFVSEHILIRVM